MHILTDYLSQIRDEFHLKPFRGVRHTSTAQYFYEASIGNMLIQTNDGFNYYLQLSCLQFLSKTHLPF
jgi:hypothetical protein